MQFPINAQGLYGEEGMDREVFVGGKATITCKKRTREEVRTY